MLLIHNYPNWTEPLLLSLEDLGFWVCFVFFLPCFGEFLHCNCSPRCGGGDLRHLQESVSVLENPGASGTELQLAPHMVHGPAEPLKCAAASPCSGLKLSCSTKNGCGLVTPTGVSGWGLRAAFPWDLME